jgi:hypothetical protein
LKPVIILTTVRGREKEGQISEAMPPRRRRRNRLRGVSRRPRGRIQAWVQALAQPMTPARVAGPGSPNGAMEVGA